MPRLVCLMLGSGLVGSSVAHAQPAATVAQNEESARAAFLEGLRLREQKGPKEALPKFAAAHALVATARTAFELARTHLMLGQLVEARALFAEIARLPIEPHESRAATEARAEAARLDKEIAPKIASLAFLTEGLPATAQVVVDGVPVPSAALVVPWRVNPGPHVVVLKVQGSADETRSVTTKEGELVEVSFSRAPSPARVAAAPPRDPPRDRKPTPDKRQPTSPPGATQRTAGLAITGGGVAALGVGAVFGILAIAASNDSQKKCGGNIGAPEPRLCNEEGIELHQTAASRATLSTVFLVGGGVLAAGGAVLWLTAPSARGARIGLSPAGATLAGRF